MSLVLHVLDGDATVEAFRAAALPGDAVVWREATIEGPWPRALREVDEAIALARAAHARGEEIVLWFDRDLFCRLNAACLLSHLDAPATWIMNATGSHDGRDLAACFASRAPVEPRLADAWRAYVAPDPRVILPLLDDLPWLRLHLGRFPHPTDGLDLVERAALQALAQGTLPFRELFARVAHGARSPSSFGLGDVQLRATLDALAPLVTRRAGHYGMTDLGAAVLRGERDRMAYATAPRWVGGAALRPGEACWRWDGAELALR